MSIGIRNKNEVSMLQVTLGTGEVLRVTTDGEFVWNPDADRMIEEGDFSFSPALPHILRALQKRQWVGLTTDEKHEFRYSHMTTADFIEAIEAKLKKKNTHD